MIIVMSLDVELEFSFSYTLALHFIKTHLIAAVNYQLKRAIEIENDDGIMIQCVRCNANEERKKKKTKSHELYIFHRETLLQPKREYFNLI